MKFKKEIINYIGKPLLIGGSFMMGVIFVYAASNTISGLGETISNGDKIGSNWFQEVDNKLMKYSGSLNISGGNVGIGTTNPQKKLDVIGSTRFEGHMSNYRSTDNSFSHQYNFYKDRSDSIVESGDTIGQVQALGYDGYEYEPLGRIDFRVDRSPGTNDMPGRIEFNTTADDSNSLSERMRIDSDGNVGIGTSSPDHSLHIKNNGQQHIRLEDGNGNQCRISVQAGCDGGWINIGSENGVNLCISCG